MKKKQTLNICFVSTQFPIVGRAAERGFLLPISRRLTKLGHKVTVLSWKNTQNIEFIEKDGVMAYFLGQNNKLGAENFRYLAKKKFESLHQQSAFDIVHSIDANGIFIGLNKKKYKIKMVYDVEATRLSQLYSIIGLSQDSISSQIKTGLAVAFMFVKTFLGGDRKLLKSADAVITHTQHQKMILERHYLFPDKKTFVIPYALDIGDLSPRDKSDELKKNLGLPINSKTVVTETDMTEMEVLRNILSAFEKLAVKKSSARLIIVGDGPLRKNIEFEAYSLALGSRVLFTGKINATDTADIITNSDVFISLSAKSSGFEPKLIEAMAQKKVVIGSEVSPVSTLIENGVNGFLIRPADKNSLSELLIKIFTNQIDSQSIGVKAREKILKIIDIDAMIDDLLKVYWK